MGVPLGNAYGEIAIGTGGAESSIANLSRTLRNTGLVLSGAISAPLGLVGQQAIGMAGDFEQSLDVMQQVSGATGGQMAQLQEQALELGADTMFGAGEAADAMLELAKSGLSVEEVSAAIPGVMDLAAASGTGLAEAAGVTAAALNTFGLDATESTRVADLLAAGANASAAEISDLGAGLQQGGFAFDAAGQDVDDLVASLAILTNVGLTGSDAGTALKNVMMRLMNPTKEASAAMESVGFAAYDAQGNMKPLSQIIGDVNTATAGMSNEQRDAFLSTVFMSDGMKAMIPLLDEGETGFLTMKDSVNESGAAGEVAGARMGGFKGALETLKGAWESLLIGTVMPWLDTMSGVTTQISGVVDWFNSLSAPVKNAALAFGLALAVIGPLMLVVSALGTVLGALFSPISLIVGAVILLGVAWANNWGGIRDKTMEVWAAIQPTLAQLVTWVQSTLPLAFAALKGWAAQAWTALSSAVSTAWAVVGPLLAQLLTWVQTTLPVAWETLRTKAAEVWTALSSAVATAWAAIQPTLALLQTWLATTIPEAASTMQALFAGAWDALPAAMQTAQAAIQTAWTTIETIFGPAVQRIVDAVDGLGQSFAPVGTALGGLGTAFSNLWTAVSPILQQLGQLIAGVFGVVALFALNLFARAIEALGPLVTAVIDQITLTINTIATIITALTVAVKAIAAGDWMAAWNALKDAFTPIWDLITGTINNLITIVSEVLLAIGTAITDTLTDLGVDIEPLLNGIKGTWDTIWGGFTGIVDTVVGAVESVKEGIQGFIDWISGISIPNPFAAIASSIGSIRERLPGWMPGSTGGDAEGTSWHEGGMHLVGERGPELITSPQGAQVLTAGQTARRLGGTETPQIVLNMGGVTVSGEMDIETLAYRLAGRIKQFAR